MHYIRFLKPPRITPDSPRALSSKITVTTDLGESFLASDAVLLVDLEDASGRSAGAAGSAKREYLWRGSAGMRALEIVLPLPAGVRTQVLKVAVRPKDEAWAVDEFGGLLEDAERDGSEEDFGRIVAVRSMPVDVTGKKRAPTGMAERVFTSRAAAGSGGAKVEVHIWEETGESIARHIWDAGLVLSSYLAGICIQKTLSSSLPQLPVLEQRLQSQKLKVLELGAGCGIVGLTLACHHPSIDKLIMTDLPEATSILTHNLSLSTHAPKSKVTQQILDWSCPLPSNIGSTPWDLVLVADCTYNPDVVPDLVTTLRAIMEGSKEALICLAMKVRHESEIIFFQLMEERGFVVVERCEVGLPVLSGEREEIEIIVFRWVGI